MKSHRWHSRQRERDWRDLRIRDQELVLRNAPPRVGRRRCGPRVKHLPWADRWQRFTGSLLSAIARFSRKLLRKESAEHRRPDSQGRRPARRRTESHGTSPDQSDGALIATRTNKDTRRKKFLTIVLLSLYCRRALTTRVFKSSSFDWAAAAS